MAELPPFIAPVGALALVASHNGGYQTLILLTRDLGDDLALFDGPVDGALLAKQIATELQPAFDDGAAGQFQVLKVGENLTPHVLNIITPATPLSPWQIDFANSYGEADYAWMQTLADTHEAGDTIFTAVMTELDAKEDCTDATEAARRLDSIIADLIKARDAIRF